MKRNLYKLIVPLLVVAMMPLKGFCADDFYKDESAADKLSRVEELSRISKSTGLMLSAPKLFCQK